MITIAFGAACFAVGLYAGKRRAAGSDWGSIAKDGADWVVSVSKTAYDKVSWPFRKSEKAPEEADMKQQ